MKNFFLCSLQLIVLAYMLMFQLSLQAQVPQSISYQGAARNSTGAVIANQTVGLKFSIRDGSLNGTVVYSETSTATTNQFGLFTASVGSGTVVSGSFSSIPWSTGNKFIQVEMDIAGGTNYADMGTSQLLSVPYALNAGNTYWQANTNTISNTNAGPVGVGTSAPSAQLHVVGSTSNPMKIDGSSPMYVSLFEAGTYRGYLGSYYSGNATDVDFGTGGSNSTGSLHLSIQSVPALSINPSKLVGIGTTNAGSTLTVVSDELPVDECILGAYYLGPANTNAIGIMGLANSHGGYGLGGYFSGGEKGVTGAAYAGGANGYFIGVDGIASGGGASSVKYAVRGTASGSGSANYGLFGDASGATTNLAVFANGNAYATGNWQTSDAKLKENIRPVTGAMDKLMALNPSVYSYKREGTYKILNLPEGEHFGLIAQEVENVIPEIVMNNFHPGNFDEITKVRTADEVEFKILNYVELIPLLISGIQELKTENNLLKEQIEQLRTNK